MTRNQYVINLLRDAYAMEQAIEKHLTYRLDKQPANPTLRQHLADTQRHITMVDGCLARHGASPSPRISPVSRFMQSPVAIATDTATDPGIGDCLVDYALEQYEVITYQALTEAAAQVGDVYTLTVCEQILQEEQRRATRFTRTLPSLVAMQLEDVVVSPAEPALAS
jgi:ferritin-like metal-binding protein YciE